MEILAWLFFWIVCAVVAGIVASNKNRLALAWALWTLLLSPLLLLILLALPAKAPPAPSAVASKAERLARQPVRFGGSSGGPTASRSHDKIDAALKARAGASPPERFGQPEAPPDTKTCPECAETVKAAAKLCRFCGHRFDQASPGQSPGATA